MNLASPIFFTDNLTLAKAATAQGVSDNNMIWAIRRQAIEYQKLAHPLLGSIFHISREINGVAHNCAQQARRSLGSEPICSCRNSPHNNFSCPVLAAIDMIRHLGFVIHDVRCF
uniref:Uncharacterized protein n=1 Tax=Avena sativa TaxID=4498 RepID=A0ACD5ZF00_AVESA